MPSPSSAPAAWSRCFALRSAVLYLVLSTFPFPLNLTPLFGWLEEAFSHLAQTIGLLVLRVTTGFAGPLPTVVNGSGDRLDAWVAQLGVLVLSLVGGLVWAAFGRDAARQEVITGRARTYLRYFIASSMLLYGASKLALNQFPAPGTDRLVQPLGDGSPMGLIWAMIGLSPAYQFIGGLMEFAGGLLLLSRRTAPLGAFVTSAVMVNVVLLNYCFDVPVKLFSTQLLLGAVILAWPHVAGVLDLLVRNRPAAPPGEPVRRLLGWRRVAVYTANSLLVILTFFVAAIAEARPVLPPLFATYEVVSFKRDGALVPPLADDAQRWRYFSLPARGQVVIRSVGGTRLAYGAKVDAEARTITLTARDHAPEIKGLTYTQTTPEALTLTGTQAGTAIEVSLRRVKAEDFLLVNRGFRWINEAPFNR